MAILASHALSGRPPIWRSHSRVCSVCHPCVTHLGNIDLFDLFSIISRVSITTDEPINQLCDGNLQSASMARSTMFRAISHPLLPSALVALDLPLRSFPPHIRLGRSQAIIRMCATRAVGDHSPSASEPRRCGKTSSDPRLDHRRRRPAADAIPTVAANTP